jgi:hypothetical protein
MDVGVLGTGAMGRNHVRVYSAMKSVDSVRVFDIATAAAREVADKNDAIACVSADELLRSVDAVSICVPTPYHHQIAEQAIAREVAMLIEKPICQTVAEAETLIGSIPDGLVVGVGHIERFNPIVDEIKRIVRKPLYIEAKRHNPGSSRITGSSVVEDLMIHDVDVMALLFDHEDCRGARFAGQSLAAAVEGVTVDSYLTIRVPRTPTTPATTPIPTQTETPQPTMTVASTPAIDSTPAASPGSFGGRRYVIGSNAEKTTTVTDSANEPSETSQKTTSGRFSSTVGGTTPPTERFARWQS